MARPRLVPDTRIHEAVHALISRGGEKAVTFAAVARETGLAPSSLADRHGSVTGMIADAREAVWRNLEIATEQALATAPLSPKGAITALKSLPDPAQLDLQSQPERALRWRLQLEASLAVRLGGGDQGRLGAAVLFSHWFSQAHWQGIPLRSIRLKDVLRALD